MARMKRTGSFNIFVSQGGRAIGGQGDDTMSGYWLEGGGGGDLLSPAAQSSKLVYASVSDSTSTGYDTVDGINFGPPTPLKLTPPRNSNCGLPSRAWTPR